MIIPRVGDAAVLKGKYMQPQPLPSYYHRKDKWTSNPPLPPYASLQKGAELIRRYEKEREETRMSALFGLKQASNMTTPPNGASNLDNFTPDFRPEKLSGVIYSCSI